MYALYLCENLKSKTYMEKPLNEEQAKLRYQLLKQQLALTVIYENDFLHKLGYKGLQEKRNDMLDEMNWLKSKFNINEKK